MDIRFMDFETPIISTLRHMMEENEKSSSNSNGGCGGGPSSIYFSDAKAMATTPADIKEYNNSYILIIDMPGVKSDDIKVQLEDENVLVIRGERKRDEEKEGISSSKYLRMERRFGKIMRKFVLPENADTESISAVCKDGVLSVTVEKLPPPEPKKPKTIQVKVA